MSQSAPASRPRISFEFFPPQSLEASFRLWETVQALAPQDPAFVSVTYGAGGTTRKLTHEAVGTIHRNYGLEVAAHLTCVDATKAETLEIVEQYEAAGVTQIVALRGDAPKGAAHWTAHPEGFASSVELVEALAKTGRYTIRVGAYPERHPDSPDGAADVTFLRRKVDAGAHSAITQFFFEADTFFRFRDAAVAAGVNVPIIPGILPVTSWEGAKKFAARCGAQVPGALDTRFTAAVAAGQERDFAVEHAAQLCEQLIAGGVEDLHFYTINRPQMTLAVLGALGLSRGDAAKVA